MSIATYRVPLSEAIATEERRIAAESTGLRRDQQRRDQLRRVYDLAEQAHAQAVERLRRLRDDPQELLEASEPEYLQAESAERETSRSETRAQNALRAFEQENPELDVLGGELERDQQTLQLGKYIVALEPLAKAYLEVADAHAKAATELHAALSRVVHKFPATKLRLGSAVLPSRQQLLELEWPEGFFVRPPQLSDGREFISIHDVLRIALANVFPELFAEDDPALGPPPANVPKISDQGVVW